jgi:hypothetical protein
VQWNDLNVPWNSFQYSWNNANTDLNNINKNTIPFSREFYDLNTRFDTSVKDFGMVYNYFYHKTSDRVLASNMLRLNNPVYSVDNEIAIDKMPISVLNSDWDSKFFRKYSNKARFTNVHGTYSHTDIKSFIGTKLLQIENRIRTGVYDKVISGFSLRSENTAMISKYFAMGENHAAYSVAESSTTIRISMENVLMDRIYAFTIDNFKQFVLESNLPDGDYSKYLKEYIRVNILNHFKITGIDLYVNNFNKRISPQIIRSVENEITLISEGYTIDKSLKTQMVNDLDVIITHTKTKEASNSFGIFITVES